MSTPNQIDYIKSDYYAHHHTKRYEQRAKDGGLLCQECQGYGYFIEALPEFYGDGPRYSCGWCRGSGYVVPFDRGQWLLMKRAEKLESV